MIKTGREKANKALHRTELLTPETATATATVSVTAPGHGHGLGHGHGHGSL